MAVAGGNVVFHLGAGRLLGAEEYSALSALLTALLVLVVPAGAIQVALTADAARIHRTGRDVGFGRLTRRFSQTGALVGVVFVALSPVVGSYLRIDGVVPMVLVGAFFVPAMAGLVLRSVLLGREQYLVLGLILAGGTAVRLVMGVTVLLAFPTATAALAVTLVSEALTAAALLVAARRVGRTDGISWQMTLESGTLVGGIAAFVGFWLLLGSDAVMARHQLGPSEAGAYAAAALAAKTVLYGPQAIVTAAIPRYAVGGLEGRRALVDSMLPAMAVGLIGAIVIVAVGPPTLGLVLGESFALSHATLAQLAVAALWAGALTALMNYHLAQGALIRANVSWIGVAVVLVGGHFAASSATLSLAVLAGVLVSGLLASTPLIRLHRPPIGVGPVGDAELDLTIVVPALNEAVGIGELVRRIDRAFADELLSLEILVVDDGSTDGTGDVAMALDHPSVRVLQHDANRGKGAALRTGMAEARGAWIGCLDGDGELDPGHLARLVSDARRFGAHGAVGSKRHPQSIVERNRFRSVVSALSHLSVRALFAVPVDDTQVGVKVLSRAMVSDALPRTRETGYLFDLELLVVAAQRGWNHVIECPVSITSCDRSTIGVGAVARSARDVMSLAARQAPAASSHDAPAEAVPVQVLA